MISYISKLFVYGSLKQGFQFSHLLDGADYIGTAELVDRFVMAKHRSYPCVIRGDDASCLLAKSTKQFLPPVQGEIFGILSREMLERLDVLEGAPNDYRREMVKARINVSSEYRAGEEMFVEMYILQNPESLTKSNTVILEEGVWSQSENDPNNRFAGDKEIEEEFFPNR